MEALDPPVIREDFFIAVEPSVDLFVRQVRATEREGVPVVLVHGARVPGVASFDLDIEHGSLAGDLALAGHDTYLFDARGYGRSTRPSAMDEAPGPLPTFSRSNEVVRDLMGVVDEVRWRTKAESVAIIGWATGGMWSGHYASLFPERVSHVVFYNSLYGDYDGHAMLGHGSVNEDPDQPGRFNAATVGPFRYNAGAELLPSWDNSIPTSDPDQWRDPELVEQYIAAALDSDVTSGERTPPSFRAPSGAMEDSFLLATGHQVFHASTITGHALVVRCAGDFWSRPEDADRLARDLHRASSVRSVVIPDATHYVHLDRPDSGRTQFLSEVLSFLAT